jgi:hypothetical protein
MGMQWLSFALEFIAVIIIVIYILNRFISWRSLPIFVYLSVLIGYLFSILMIFALPIDVAVAEYDACQDGRNETTACDKPFNYLTEEVFYVIWTVMYWTVFVLTWALYPILQAYVVSGEFTFWDKFKAALRANLIYYLVVGVIGIAMLLWLYLSTPKEERDFNQTINLTKALGNAWGLFLIVSFLGFGLVHIPRYLWRISSVSLRYKYLSFELVNLNKDMHAAHKELDRVLKLIKKTSDKVRPEDPYRQFVDKIVAQCPPEYQELTSGDGSVKTNYDDLVALNATLKSAVHNYRCALCIYEETLKTTFGYEDVLRMKDQRAKYKIRWSFREERTHKLASTVNFVEWLWWGYVSKWAFRALAILLALFSMAIVWSELVFFIKSQDLSIPSLIIHAPGVNSFGLQVLIFVPLTYMGICTYTSLFSLKLFNYYKLLPHQQTDAYSIIFSASYISRLSASLALNFLHLINYTKDNADDSTSAFVQAMGDINVLPIAKYFNLYFPIFIAVFVIATIFNLWGKILACFRIKQFEYDEDEEDEQAESGKGLLVQEREARLNGETLFEQELKKARGKDLDTGSVFGSEGSVGSFTNKIFGFFRGNKAQSPAPNTGVKMTTLSEGAASPRPNEDKRVLIPEDKTVSKSRPKYPWEEDDSEDSDGIPKKEYGSF